jgi:hypothetical protein
MWVSDAATVSRPGYMGYGSHMCRGHERRSGAATEEDEPLVEVRATLANHAVGSAILAVASTVFVLAIFDWDAGGVAIWAAVGAVVWGVFDFFIWVVKIVPRDELPTPPPDAVVETHRRVSIRRVVRLAVVIAACFGLAWLATEMDAGAVSVPGQFIGYACAALLGTLWVARWERRHRRTVIARPDDEDDEATLYAIGRG